jgi:hypothetical protein
VMLRRSGDIASARSMRYGEKALADAERGGGFNPPAGRGGGMASLGSPRRPVSGPLRFGNISSGGVGGSSDENVIWRGSICWNWMNCLTCS